ncbi:hypothetical protein PV327_003951 [Microctonus hyperodae]|uniref:Nucleolar protein 11 n=1 Tax=Microctonus hyperodae TaxID=165561 RepID=A0AA39G5I5_MICHY|nr:hypothetical protein PV327_003951 [Microctonus hyperodae]
MAKLNSYYTLCPLIDQQNLLGVEKDADSGCAIVTLGRNIVIRYKLHDLKQVSSWSTKERLTTPVIYDKQTDRYVAIFNEKHIRVWSKNETDLDKVKRYKFRFPFQTILSLDSTSSPVLVRQDGATASLEWARDNKTWSSNGILLPKEKILNCYLINVNSKMYLCALTKIDSMHNFIVVGLQEETFHGIPEEINRIELIGMSEKLIGHVILQDHHNAYLLTLWSHGRLYSYPLTGSCPDPVPGMLVSVFSSISTNHPVVMVPLNDSTIAAYGADVNEEGAVLLIYDIKFKLVQAIQKLKLYTNEAKLWRIDDKLLLAANRHLAIAPYRLTSQKIEAMLGSLCDVNGNAKANDEDDIVEIRETVIANWQDAQLPPSSDKLSTKCVSHKIEKQINVLLNEGKSDAAILQVLIPQLIESKDVPSIIYCLENFNDLSEKLLIDLLLFGIRTHEKTFLSKKNDSDNNINAITRNSFLDRLLSINFSDITVMSHLKSSLDFNEVLRFINYLINKLNSADDVENIMVPNETQLYKWTSLFIDSYYQHYLLSQDPEVLEVLHKLKNILDDHFHSLMIFENLRPMVQRIIHGKPLKPTYKEYSKFYMIEEVQLY